MERSVSAPRGDPTRRNQGLERPVPAHRCRTHAPPEPAICVIIFTGNLLVSLDDPLSYSDAPSSSTTQTTLTAHTPKHVPILAAGNSSTTSTATKRCKSASSSTARADKDKLLPTTTTTAHSPTKALPFPRVLRRVQAVIQVPVKEEEDDEDGNRADWPPDSAILRPTSTPTGTSGGAGAGAGTSNRGGGGARRRKSSASSRRSLVVPPSVEGGRSFVDDEEEGEEEALSDEEGTGEYVDEEEVEIAIANGTPATGRQKTVPWGKKHIGREPDEEDDELMMYAKVDTPFLFLVAFRVCH